MPEPSQTFDDAITSWQDWQRTPWGRLRYVQAEANLLRHLDGEPLRVLDLAGGNGADATRLAAHGHRVTLVDYSPQMLAAAEQEFRAAGLADRLTLVDGDVAALPPEVGADYDVVLCHNLVQYVADPAATLAVAAERLRPDGLLSVMAINRDSEVLQHATRELDPAAALAALDATETWTATFATTVRHYTATEATGWLGSAGCAVVGHYGIRAVSDYIHDNDRKYDPEFSADLERLELAVADRMPYPLIARFFHLVARRTA